MPKQRNYQQGITNQIVDEAVKGAKKELAKNPIVKMEKTLNSNKGITRAMQQAYADRQRLGDSRFRTYDGLEHEDRRQSGRQKSREEIKQQLGRIAALSAENMNGQNSVEQAKHFNRAAKIAGLVEG